MQILITAVGPDNSGLADPIIHYVTGQGANIAEIQMYDHDEEAVFAMLCRIELPGDRLAETRQALTEIGRLKGLSVRVWSPEERRERPRLAICATYRPEPPLAVLRAIRDKQIRAEAAVMIGNRNACRSIAEQFGVDWRLIGDADGKADDERLQPYQDAYTGRMLTYGATCHFIVPELDAGNQIIHQSTFTVPPGTKLDEIVRIGQTDNEPRCLVEGVRRVVSREVQLHFHRVVKRT